MSTKVNRDETFNTVNVTDKLTATQLAVAGTTAFTGAVAASSTLGVTGLSTLSGGATTPGNEGLVYSGTLSASGATTTVALNTRVGTVTVTGVGDIAANANANAEFLNSLATANTIGLVALQTTTAAATSTPRIEAVTFAAGTVTVAIRNSGAVATGAGANYTFSFILFN